MTQVIGRSELASVEFIANLASGDGVPTVLWVVDLAITVPGAGDGPLTDLNNTLTSGGINAAVAKTTFPREPKIPQVDALAAEIRALENPVIVAVGGGSTMDGAKLAAAVAVAQLRAHPAAVRRRAAAAPRHRRRPASHFHSAVR